MDAKNLEFLSQVLANLKDASVDWAEVAKIRGISRKDNASTRFKAIMRQHGIDYSNNTFTLVGGNETAAAIDDIPTTKAKKPSTPRKRKFEDKTSDDHEAEPSSIKRPRAKPAANIKKDDDGEEEEEAGA